MNVSMSRSISILTRNRVVLCSRSRQRRNQSTTVCMATRSTLANTVNAVQTDGDGGVRKENDGISGTGALHKVDSQGPGLEHQEQEQQQKKTKSTVVAPKTIESGKALPAQLSIWDNAMILVDKPQTWTSFDVCAKLRGALAATLQVKSRKVKVGHAGTLDPMATGLLIVCVGKGTKSIESFVGMNKEYSGTLRLGESTDSYDADGKIVDGSQEWQHVTGTVSYTHLTLPTNREV